MCQSGELLVHIFRSFGGAERLVKVTGKQPVPPPPGRLTRARTVLRNGAEGFSTFNPSELLNGQSSIFSFLHGRVIDLELDPKEWYWPKIGQVKAGNFFKYSTKRGYRIINSREGKTPPFTSTLINASYSPEQCRKFYKDLWHPWLPKKVSTMLWLTCQGGLPLAA